MKPTPIYDELWHFAAERMNIFWRRANGHPFPWTEDSILQTYKFTNAYRVLDRVSQYLISNVIYDGLHNVRPPEDTFFRIILFKLFNRIETWQALEKEFLEISIERFRMQRWDHFLQNLSKQQSIYSAAYMMPPIGRHAWKHQGHLNLLDQMIRDDVPKRIAEMNTQKDAFELLKSYPGIGNFLAYQFVIDLDYAPNFDLGVDGFVVPGPGAIDGIHKCFSDLDGKTEAEVIWEAYLNQAQEFRERGIDFRSLFGHTLKPIDIQNLFCEISKYSRKSHPGIKGPSGRTKIKQKFHPNETPISRITLPEKWDLEPHPVLINPIKPPNRIEEWL